MLEKRRLEILGQSGLRVPGGTSQDVTAPTFPPNIQNRTVSDFTAEEFGRLPESAMDHVLANTERAGGTGAKVDTTIAPAAGTEGGRFRGAGASGTWEVSKRSDDPAIHRDRSGKELWIQNEDGTITMVGRIRKRPDGSLWKYLGDGEWAEVGPRGNR